MGTGLGAGGLGAGGLGTGLGAGGLGPGGQGTGYRPGGKPYFSQTAEALSSVDKHCVTRRSFIILVYCL